MLFDNATTSTKQGDIGEARAIYEYTKLGYVVSRTIFDSATYDLIIDDGNTLQRVQVKTTKCKVKSYGKYAKNSTRTGYQVQLTTSGGNRQVNIRRGRSEEDYDLLFVLTEEGRCWSIPTTALDGAKNGINVGATGHGAKYVEYELL